MFMPLHCPVVLALVMLHQLQHGNVMMAFHMRVELMMILMKYLACSRLGAT